MPIRTQRLDLIPGTAATLRAELDGRDHLARVLGAEVPAAWPPPLYDEDATRWMLDQIAENPAFERWGFHYFLLRSEGHGGIAVGAGGFKGPPFEESVEIGYSVLPAFQRQGFATEAVGGLLDFAYQESTVGHVIAETLPDLTPSIGVLQKAGFVQVDSASEPGVIRFEHRPVGSRRA